MTIASEVIKACEGKAAYTLYGGYAAGYDAKVVRFPGGHCEFEKRNEKGRVIKARYQYADGSCVEFTYKNETPRLKEL